MAAEDTEITLGMGKLLGLFFMLAATCGIFFAVGYSLGKTAAREQALNNAAAQTQASDTDTDIASPKPSAAPVRVASTATAGENGEAAKETAPEMTFYNAVKQDPHAEGASAQGLKSPTGAANQAGTNSPAKKSLETPAARTAVTGKPIVIAKAESEATSTAALPQANSAGTYLVQIAAVTHEEDAAALAGALRKKSYAAAVVNNPSGKDKLFHVVLGPYASLQDAEAMKAKLQGEGYSPIVKR